MIEGVRRHEPSEKQIQFARASLPRIFKQRIRSFIHKRFKFLSPAQIINLLLHRAEVRYAHAREKIN